MRKLTTLDSLSIIFQFKLDVYLDGDNDNGGIKVDYVRFMQTPFVTIVNWLREGRIFIDKNEIPV